MADDLRMKAEVTDHASGPLRRIREELAAFRETEGMKSLKESMTVLREQTAEFTKVSAGAGNVMGGIGIGSLAASASIGELIKTFKELAERTADLRALSKETGLTVDAINQLEHVAERFHVSPEKMGAALGVLADKMVDFKRHTGDLFGELNQQAPDIAKRLLGENPQQQVDEILKFLDTIKNSGVRKRWADAFFGDGDIARLVQDGYGKFAEEQTEAAKNVPKLTAEYQRQAEAFNQSIISFNDSMEKLETSTGPYLFKELRATADNFREIFEDVTKAIDWIKGEKGKSVGEIVHDVGHAEHGWLERQHEINEARRKAGNGPIIDLPGAVLGPNGDIRSEDGNALHRNDEMPVGPKGSSWLGRLFGGSVQKSSFETFGGSAQAGSGTGFQDILQRATRAGVAQGLQDYADMRSAAASAGGGRGGGGLQLASYEAGSPGALARGPGDLGMGGDAPGSLLDLIRKGETGSLGPESYRAITNLWHGARPDVTKMTIDQVLAFQKQMLAGGVSDTAVGGFQINGTTLQDFKSRMHLSGSEMFDPDMQTRIAGAIAGTTGGSLGGLRGRWSSLNKVPDSTILGALGGGSGSASTAVDHAMKLIGGGINEAAHAFGSRMTPGEWCADFVNGALKSAGMHGVNSSMSQAFRAWGHAVGLKDVKKGDVIVEDHGGGHGHVGMATGRINPKTGAIEMVSGNYGNRVHTNWERPGEIAALRRSNEQPSLWDHARAAGMGPQNHEVTHKGSAEVTIKGLPNGASAHTKTEGLISKVKLHRSTTMPEQQWTA